MTTTTPPTRLFSPGEHVWTMRDGLRREGYVASAEPDWVVITLPETALNPREVVGRRPSRVHLIHAARP